MVVRDDGTVLLADGTHCDERYACHCQDCESDGRGPQFADDRYSLGIYAGRMCDAAWKRSGYRDEGYSGFHPDDCGESYDPD